MIARTLALLGVVTALLLGTVAQAQPQPAAPPEPVYTKSEAVIRRATGGDVKFAVELALTPEQQQHGLMFRKEVKPYEGMLFDFGPERPIAMWMKNTLVPLDMLFIAADGRITRIAANTKPHSLDTIDSGSPVKAVLEIAGGSALLLGIKPGDRVIHPMFSLKAF